MIFIENLSFSFRSKPVFSSLDLSLPGGGICGLLGRNGAGKTTLLKVMAGLRFPREGTVMVADDQPSNRSSGFLKNLFLIPEEFRLPPVSPREYERLFAPFYPGFDVDQYGAYLEGFELDPRENLSRCSFGQRKKVLIAFGLATNCRLTLFDEPTNGLDIPSKAQFRRALASVLTEKRLFVIATHQVRDLESLIDPVVILENGEIIFNRTLAEISRHLRVETLPSLPKSGDVLFSEKKLDGFRVVLENTGGADSFMDLETLFQTVLKSRDRLEAVFEKEDDHEH